MNAGEQFVSLAMAGTVFVLVLSLWLSFVLFAYIRHARHRERVEERLGLAKPKGAIENPRILRLWRDGKTITTIVEGGTIRHSLMSRMEHARMELGLNASPFALISGLLLTAVVAIVLVFGFTGNHLMAVGAGLIIISIPVWLVKRKLAKKSELFENQLADALDLATRSLRAGHPLAGAFRLIEEETEPPVSLIFGDITQQQSLGVALDVAIRNTAAQTTSPDMKLFAASMTIQLRSGGNLADMLDRVSAVIRDRIRLYRRARVLTSETQLSKRILIALPILLLFGLQIIKPEYLEPLYTTSPGKFMIGLAVILLFVGSWVMNRIAVIRF